MASKYGRAMGKTNAARRAIQSGLATAGKKQIGVKQFELEQQLEFEERAVKGSQKYQTAKTIGGLVMGGLAIATGTAPLAAALMAGGGTVAGGMVGKKQATDIMGDFKWYGNKQMDLERGMNKETINSALVNAVLAGVGAGGDKAVGEVSKEVVEKGAEEVAKGTGEVVAEGVKKAAEKVDDWIPDWTKKADVTKAQAKWADKVGMSPEGVASADPSQLTQEMIEKYNLQSGATRSTWQTGPYKASSGAMEGGMEFGEAYEKFLGGGDKFKYSQKSFENIYKKTMASGAETEAVTKGIPKATGEIAKKTIDTGTKGYGSIFEKKFGADKYSFVDDPLKQAGANVKSAFGQFLPKRGMGSGLKTAATVGQLWGVPSQDRKREWGF